jgi:hypothetical protein
MATGAPNPAAPSRKAPKEKAGLHAVVGGEPRDRPLHDVEGPGLERELIEKHGRYDDPANGKEAEGGSVDGGGQGGVGRHADDSHGDGQSGGQARPGRGMG